MMNSTKFGLAAGLVLFVCGGTSYAKEMTDPALLAQAKISEKMAQATALAKVSKGQVISSELEEENGKLIWSFDISKPKTKNVTEIQVDAKTGMIVSSKVETPRKEVDEAAAEAKEATAVKK